VELFEQLAFAVLQGALAIMSERFEPSTREALTRLKTPLVETNELPLSGKNFVDLARQNHATYEAFRLSGKRGRIGRDCVADLQLIRENATNNYPPHLPYKVARLLVAGETVWENGKRTGSNPGVLLRGK
jgi:hypothetical protein